MIYSWLHYLSYISSGGDLFYRYHLIAYKNERKSMFPNHETTNDRYGLGIFLNTRKFVDNTNSTMTSIFTN